MITAIVLFLVIAWVLIWTLSALLAGRLAKQNGYRPSLFVGYGLLIGPWAYRAAQQAPSYAVESPKLLPSGESAPKHLQVAETPAPSTDDPDTDGGLDAIELAELEAFAHSLETETGPVEASQETIWETVEDDSIERVEEEPEEIEAEVEEEEEAPVEEEPEEVSPGFNPWTTRSGDESAPQSFTDLAKLEVSQKLRSRNQSLELVPIEPKPSEVVEEDREQKVSNKFWKRKARNQKEVSDSLEAPSVIVEKKDPSQAIAPSQPMAGECPWCLKASYPSWHGLCVRCSEVWPEQTAGKK